MCAAAPWQYAIACQGRCRSLAASYGSAHDVTRWSAGWQNDRPVCIVDDRLQPLLPASVVRAGAAHVCERVSIVFCFFYIIIDGEIKLFTARFLTRKVIRTRISCKSNKSRVLYETTYTIDKWKSDVIGTRKAPCHYPFKHNKPINWYTIALY